MKKFNRFTISFLLIIVMIFLNTSCEKKESIDNSKINVLEVEINGYINDYEFNHNFNVDSSPEIYVKEAPVEKNNVEIFGKNIGVKYSDTIFYPIGDITVDRHKILESDRENPCILLRNDGSIYAILDTVICTLDISKSESPDTVKTLLEKSLSKLISFDDYDSFKVESSRPQGSEKFGIYDCIWYNSIDSITNGYVKICVNDDGEVFAIWIIPGVSESDINKNISFDNIDKAISDKLPEIYTTEKTTLSGYEIFSLRFASYQGKTYVYAAVSVHFIDNMSKDILSNVSELLVDVSKTTNEVQ